PGFSDEHAPESWKTDPIWQGARRTVEHIVALRDWMEVVVAVNLCFDRVFGELTRLHYFSRFASASGDVVTPMIIASAEADHVRTRSWTKTLLAHLISDPAHGAANLDIISGWVDTWTTAARAACEAFRPAFERAPVKPVTFDDAL